MKKKKIVTPEVSWHEVENNRLKGEIQAVKHYYAVLIAKNVAKVEEVQKKLESRYDVSGYTKPLGELAELNVKKMKKCRTKSTRDLLQKNVDFIVSALQFAEEMSRDYKEINHKLRQVL